MSGGQQPVPDWEKLLAAERHLQALVPGTVLVGGTAAALHAGHRRSHDGDHVLADLRDRFDEVLSALDGIPTGIRQLRRTAPLEVEEVEGLRVPTLPEMARIKAWLLATRNTVRDYLDLVVLLERLGDDDAVEALASLDELYPQPQAWVIAEVVERLAAAGPVDRAEVELSSYRGLVVPWNRWEHVAARGRHFAKVLVRDLLEGADS